jgi:hypothetical protein
MNQSQEGQRFALAQPRKLRIGSCPPAAALFISDVSQRMSALNDPGTVKLCESNSSAGGLPVYCKAEDLSSLLKPATCNL